jgi:hypothetical protein
MNNTKTSLDYQYNSSQLAHTYGYLTIPLLEILPPPPHMQMLAI